MSETNDTDSCYFSIDEIVSRPRPPVAMVRTDIGRPLVIYPFGDALRLSMSVDRWRELSAAVEKAIADAEAPAVAS